MREDIDNLIWELFEKTGNPSYYLLHKRLKNGEKDGGDRPQKH